MHVLLIGGNRFVGRLLAWRLLAGGHRVTLLNRGNVADPFGERVERLRADRAGPDFERLLEGRSFDAVVDLAAYTGEDGRRAAALLEGRTRHYLMVSTGQVYLVREGCPHPAREPAREEYYDGPVMARPEDPAERDDWEYGVGKRACEDALAAARGFPATRVRIPMVNGPLDYFRRIERYLWRLADGGPVILPGGGAHRVRHVDGSEVARFLASILLREDTFGRAYNLAQEETPTLRELVEALGRLLGSGAAIAEPPAERVRAAGLDPAVLSPFHDRWMSFLDPGRARDELGFRHAPLEHCLAAVVSSFTCHTRADRPPGCERRAEERALALALASGGAG
ncbi:MAG: NAD-dependent epimerase/dehydratase family protein [Deltaproteobacteria bacterium]|nr:NAD-dependent epimerase/dehydratase family protein [Deltaproteobacteria bacterium]